ncbi:hypothetical protein AIS09_21325 [Salmonella enterica]|nr:hypothetical protein [Salmonella enterica]EAX2706602.1 hypothetical protein [Salmonella enterica]
MNIFSLVDSPDTPVHLTTENYEKKTLKARPYVQEINGKTKYYALCPQCKNPISLVNPFYQESESGLFYAKHEKHDVPGIALYNEARYLSCPLHNPSRLDSREKREPGTISNEIKDLFHQHAEIIFYVAESFADMNFSYPVKEAMLKSFGNDEGYRYRAIHKFNLPIGFLYMTNGQDIYGCKPKTEKMKEAINNSINFHVHNGYIKRKNNNYKAKIILFFSGHKTALRQTNNKEIVTLNIAEKTGESTDASVIIYSKPVEYGNDFFQNWLAQKTRLHVLARKFIK